MVKKPIAFKDYTSSVEALPLPVALYPGFYGTFFGFKSEEDSDKIYLCSCSRKAIENYIQLRPSFIWPYPPHKRGMLILDSGSFPKELIDALEQQKSAGKSITPKTILGYLLFADSICHECNKVTPQFRYCHEMYSTAFIQNHGWYVNKQRYEYGIGDSFLNMPAMSFPQELQEIVKIDPTTYLDRYFDLKKTDPRAAEKFEKEYNRQQKRMWAFVENQVRVRFGYKPIGEAWSHETALYRLVKRLYPQFHVVHHFKPDFLSGLEIDVWIEEIRVGIEYQGIQHFQPVKHWGGESALLGLKRRDKMKKKICDSLDIPLIYFQYDEELTEDSIRNRIEPNVSSRIPSKKTT